MSLTDPTDMESVIAAARASMSPQILFQDKHFAKVFVPATNGTGAIVNVPLEKTLSTPVRKRGVVTVFDAASFNMVLADNKDAGDISIYINRDPENPTVTAVLNGNGTHGPGWGDFLVSIDFRPTPQWLRWKSIDSKFLDQLEFAEFVEDNLADIREPAGATMLEIASYLVATKSADFKSGVRLSSGQVQFQNIENIETKVGAGAIEVPEMITLGIAPLQGSAAYSVPTRFRYRLTDGRLKLGIKLQRVEDLMHGVIDDVIAKIERGTNISVFEGLAPSPTA